MTRDLTHAQFLAACKRNGIKRVWLGYYAVNDSLRVYAANAGPRRRTQLAYLLQEQAKAQKELDRYARATANAAGAL